MNWLQIFNAAEAVLWTLIGLELLRRNWFEHGPSLRTGRLAGLTFIAFGASDVVEVFTGAFWRPWWLLVWKGACIICLLMLWYRHRRSRAVQSDQTAAGPGIPES